LAYCSIQILAHRRSNTKEKTWASSSSKLPQRIHRPSDGFGLAETAISPSSSSSASPPPKDTQARFASFSGDDARRSIARSKINNQRQYYLISYLGTQSIKQPEAQTYNKDPRECAARIAICHPHRPHSLAAARGRPSSCSSNIQGRRSRQSVFGSAQ
jgi:hypothetical protein